MIRLGHAAALTACLCTVSAAEVPPPGEEIPRFHLRDEQVLQPGFFATWLEERSFDPESRRMVAEAQLAALDAERRVALAAPAPVRRLSISNQGIRDLVTRIGADTGMDPSYLVRLAIRESALDPLARSNSSSAGGLFQFTEGTWLCAVRDFGGMASVPAITIRTDASGRCLIDNAVEKNLILDLRFDPVVSTRISAAVSLRNYRQFSAVFGQTPTWVDLYALHFFGVDTGLAFLRLNQTTPYVAASAISPAAARANPSIFYDSRNRPRTVAELYRNFAS